MGNESSTNELATTIVDEDEGDRARNSEATEETGFMLSIDRDYEVVPTTKICPVCPKDDNKHPLEYFTRQPCCCMHSDDLCRRCMSKHRDWCGDCLTKFPQGNDDAILWLLQRGEKQASQITCDKGKLCTLLGRAYVCGSGTFLDELQRLPIYERLQPPSDLLSYLNPPCVQQGVMYLSMAAQKGKVSAMLDLADVYCTTWKNDPFEKDKKKAEYWFQRAIGKGNKINPLAITRYADFLKWEGRFVETRKAYMLAAVHGHARGQYEYALCLLKGIGRSEGAEHQRDRQRERHQECSNEETSEAIQWLCKASENGFHIPSHLRLAKLLIQIFEREFGTAKLPGRSPLPRALQILSLIEDGIHGNSAAVREEAKELLERHNLGERCANCGVAGSENNPLLTCGGCEVVCYCSRICLRRDFRDGHKFDCCSKKTLFDHHSIEMSLPWMGNARGQAGASQAPLLRGPQSRTLMQLVEDDTDEVYGDQELGYDEHILTQLMLRMRINLETYLERRLMASGQTGAGDEEVNSSAADVRNLTLKNRIDAFSGHPGVTEEFVTAMHRIRELGNSAAHRSRDSTNLRQEDCEQAVREYRQCKEEHEINKSRANQNTVAALEAKDCNEVQKGDETTGISHDVSAPAPKVQRKKKRKKKRGKK